MAFGKLKNAAVTSDSSTYKNLRRQVDVSSYAQLIFPEVCILRKNKSECNSRNDNIGKWQAPVACGLLNKYFNFKMVEEAIFVGK